MFEAAADAVRTKADTFLEKQVNMAALVIEQVYTAALDNGVTVALDMSRVEDEGAACTSVTMPLSGRAHTHLYRRHAAGGGEAE